MKKNVNMVEKRVSGEQQLGSVEYGILKEAIVPEEFFVLVSGIEYENAAELQDFVKSLANLISQGLLDCEYQGRKVVPTEQDFKTYVGVRLGAKEDLGEHPQCCTEYYFTTTEKGIALLRPEDKPEDNGSAK